MADRSRKAEDWPLGAALLGDVLLEGQCMSQSAFLPSGARSVVN